VHSVFVTRAGGEPVGFAGSALDMRNATFLNRTRLPGCGGRVLEQRWYAHRALRSVLVYEMQLLGSTTGDAAAEDCVVELSSCNLNTTEDVDVVSRAEPRSAGAVVARNCTTKTPESDQAPLVTVAMRFHTVGTHVTLAPGKTERFVAVMRTSLPDDEQSSSTGPSDAAAADFAEAVSVSPAVLQRSHVAAWAQLRRSRVELGPAGQQRNASSIAVAAAINSSFYALLSSIRSDWAGGFGTSPGGLANSAYEGHTFWDMEEWHYPALAPLYPDIGRQMMSYRSSRLAAAKAEAHAYGQAGARYPIESGLLGREVCRATSISKHELHTTGDVAMAHRLQYRVTKNNTWLAESWPVIEACAQFWASRVTACNRSTHPNNFTVLGVIGADERAGVVDDNAYTNALVTETLEYAGWVAGEVGAMPGSNWSQIAAGMLLPVVEGIYGGGAIHLENRQYKPGQMIEQSDVGLLQYPLLRDMPLDLKANDLAYWESHTLTNGFYTGDSSYAIAWMAIGRRDMCDAQFFRAFSYQNGLAGTRYANPSQYNPFNVWKERASEGGHLNFLTGAGGFLQNVIQGYAGWRARATRLEFRPVLPPFTGLVRLVGLKYAGATFSLEYTATSVTLELLEAAAAARLVVDAGGSTRHVLKQSVPLELPAQAFSMVSL
jgi:trehalose/maltose hydrolase-like predicted phosphorylase